MPIIELEKISEMKMPETSVFTQTPSEKVYSAFRSIHIENTDFAVTPALGHLQAPLGMDGNCFFPIIGYSRFNVILEDLEGGPNPKFMYRAYITDTIKNPEHLVVDSDTVGNYIGHNNPDLLLMDGFSRTGEAIPRRENIKRANGTTIHEKGFSYDNSKASTTWILLQMKCINEPTDLRMEALAILR